MTAKKTNTALTPEERLQNALVPVDEQPYDVPENWCWVRMNGLYEINPKNQASNDTTASFVPMERIAPGMVSNFTYEIQPWGKAKKGHTQFADGDVAFAKISPCFENRKSMMINGLENGIGAGTTELIVLRQPLVDQAFTFWMVADDRFIQGGNQTYSGTVGQQRISMDYVRDYPVALPPISEQKRIVERIESLFAKLDSAKAMLEDALSRFETRKAAVLHKAATGELTVQWRMDNNIDFSSWSHRPLKEICERIFDGPFGSNLKSDDYVDSGIRVVRLENLKSLWFDDSKQSFVTEQKYESIKSHTVFPSDIIMSTFIADETKVCEMPPHIPFAVNKADCIGIRLNGENCKRFILYYLASPDVYKTLFSQIHGATRPRVNTTQIKEISVPIPSIEEQEEIVRILDAFFERENAVRKTIEERLAKIELYKKSILADAFRGELGTNDPSDEPATELLKKILA